MSSLLKTVYDKPPGTPHRKPVRSYTEFIQGLQAAGALDPFWNPGGVHRARRAHIREEDVKLSCAADTNATLHWSAGGEGGRLAPGEFRDRARMPESKDRLLFDIDSRQRRDNVRGAYQKLCAAEVEREDRAILENPAKPRPPRLSIPPSPIPAVRGGRPAPASPAASTPSRPSRPFVEGYTPEARARLHRETLDYNKSVMDAKYEERLSARRPRASSAPPSRPSPAAGL